MRLNDHARAQERSIDAIAQPLYGARVLVAKDDRRIRLEVVVPDVDIGTADARVPDTDHHFTGGWVAQLDLAQLQLGVPGRDLHEADHVRQSTTYFMPWPERNASMVVWTWSGVTVPLMSGRSASWSASRIVIAASMSAGRYVR